SPRPVALSKKAVAGPQPTVSGDLLVFLSMFAAMAMILLTKAPHERIRSFASYCLDDRSRHADAARLDRSDTSDALSFFAPRLACRRSSRTSLHHGRIPVVELGIGPSTCGSRGRVLKS